MLQKRIKRKVRKRGKAVATGIYPDPYGFGIPIRGKEHRFPLGTPLEQLRRERRRLIEDAGPVPARGGTIAADAEAYLQTIPDGKPRTNASNELMPWVHVFGARASADLSALQIKQQRAIWMTRGPKGKPVSKKHLNNMLHRLRAMYAAVHGRALNPADDVAVLRLRAADARAISYKVLDLIIDGMSDTRWPVSTKPNRKPPPPNLAKLRLRVMRYTGLAQAMVKRVEHDHLNFRKKTMYVTIRLKGGGVEAATLKMIDKAVAAWRALAEAGGLGHFSTRTLAQAWRRAVNRARRIWDEKEATKARPRPFPIHPKDRAYDLRHSFGTWALVETGDLEATAEMLRHRNLNTTRRYTKAAAKVRAARAVGTLNQSKGF